MLWLADASSLTSAPLESGMAPLWHMLLSLGCVLALLCGLLWLVKKWGRVRSRVTAHSSSIHILERKPLHAKASLYLLEVRGKQILIAESSGGIYPLTTFPTDASPEEELPSPSPKSLSLGTLDFKTLWSRLIQRKA